LSQGTYNGTITITSGVAANSPQLVGVTLQVSAVPTNNEIGVTCSPSSGKTGETVNCSIYIYGNINAIDKGFGLEFFFDDSMFDYVGTNGGSLTGNWAIGAGYVSDSGKVTLGGYPGLADPIQVGSSGTIAVVVLRVTGGTYPNGQQSTITIRAYADDIAGMRNEPSSTTFTYNK
jgi:hypothetical protein